MSIVPPKSLASTLPLSLIAGLVFLSPSAASTISPDAAAPLASETQAVAESASASQNSASAWASSNGDHGITVTTTRSGDSTSCMVVEWKRENGVVRKWQYRCDAGQP
jgi:hypothetical protein